MSLVKYFVGVGVVVATLFVGAGVRAEESGTRTTIKVVTVVGNPRRPSVTIEVTKQKMNVPLHELKHALDEKALSAAAPL